jgi:antitoxin component of MazEF toxin-antitoxin module
MKLKLCRVDNDVALVLPADVVSQLDWGPGDECEGEVHGGELRVVRTETKHAAAMKIARQMMEEYRDTFEKLAKS